MRYFPLADNALGADSVLVNQKNFAWFYIAKNFKTEETKWPGLRSNGKSVASFSQDKWLESQRVPDGIDSFFGQDDNGVRTFDFFRQQF